LILKLIKNKEFQRGKQFPLILAVVVAQEVEVVLLL
jgi:hypothetical protein